MRKLATQAAGVWKINKKTKTGRPQPGRTLAMRRAKAPESKRGRSETLHRAPTTPCACAYSKHIPKHRLNPRPRCSQRRAHRANDGTPKYKATSSGEKTRKAVTYAAVRVHAFAKHTKTQTERPRPRRILASHAESQRRHKQTKKLVLFGRIETLSAVPNTPRMRQYRSMQRNKQKPGATACWTQPLQQRERAF